MTEVLTFAWIDLQRTINLVNSHKIVLHGQRGRRWGFWFHHLHQRTPTWLRRGGWDYMHSLWKWCCRHRGQWTRLHREDCNHWDCSASSFSNCWCWHHLRLFMGNQKISTDLKLCALWLWELGYELGFISESLCISQASIYQWCNIFAEFSSVNWPPSPLLRRLRIIICAVLTGITESSLLVNFVVYVWLFIV